MPLVSKSEFAQTLRVSRARVSQYVKQGLPVRPDGLLDLDEALNWVTRNVEPDADGGGASVVASELLRGRAARPALGRSRAKVAPPLPPFFKSLEKIESPTDSMAMVALFHMLRGIGAKAALAAYEAGAPKEIASRAGEIMTCLFVGEIETFAKETGIKIPGGLMFPHPRNFDEVAWDKLGAPGAMALPHDKE